jgi:hypothetical protein
MGHILRLSSEAQNGKHYIAFCNPAAVEKISGSGLKHPKINQRDKTKPILSEVTGFVGLIQGLRDQTS